jgi:hypothetical protein
MRAPSLSLILACLFGSVPARAQSSDPVTITIQVFNYAQMPRQTLESGEHEAERVLTLAGARVKWLHCRNVSSLASESKALCDYGLSPQTPTLRFITGTNKRDPREYGYTDIPVLSTVYYEKIVERSGYDFNSADIPVVLGCVIAHELGHLLLRSSAHSLVGIMQPQWGTKQFQDALKGVLFFTKEQAVRIQSQYTRQPLSDNALTYHSITPLANKAAIERPPMLR